MRNSPVGVVIEHRQDQEILWNVFERIAEVVVLPVLRRSPSVDGDPVDIGIAAQHSRDKRGIDLIVRTRCEGMDWQIGICLAQRLEHRRCDEIIPKPHEEDQRQTIDAPRAARGGDVVATVVCDWRRDTHGSDGR